MDPPVVAANLVIIARIEEKEKTMAETIDPNNGVCDLGDLNKLPRQLNDSWDAALPAIASQSV